LDKKLDKGQGKSRASNSELAPGQGRRDLREWARRLEAMELGAGEGGAMSEFERMLGVENPMSGVVDEGAGTRADMVAVVTLPGPLMAVVPSPAPVVNIVAVANAGFGSR
jgi:hypothetical protein